MEEFQEADVMWPQTDDDHALMDCFSELEHDSEFDSSEESDVESAASPVLSSAAIDMFPRGRSGGNPWMPNDSSDDDADVRGEMIPPHVLVKMRMSMYSKNGSGALKGRLLRQLRNSVLRMTGFLET